LLRKGLLKTAQASVYTFNGKKGNDTGKVNRIYDVAFSGAFWIHKISGIKTWNDCLYLLKAIRKGIIRD